MRVDFHTHSDCSDGALSVAELLQRARDNDVQMFAITDHDTVKGVHLAAQVQAGLGESLLRLVSGVELSTCWQGVSIHVVGLNFDPDSPSLAAYLAQIDQARSDRAELIANPFVELLSKLILAPRTVSTSQWLSELLRTLDQTNPPFVDKSIPLVMVCVESLPV